MTRIHPTAIVDSKAELDPSVEVGPYAIIEGGVHIAAGTRVGPYVHIQGLTEIGPDNTICTGATVGHAPQHLAYDGRPSWLRIGARNTIREYANIHRSYEEGGATTVGDENFIMGFSHIGHDCHVGSHTIIANGALVAGHVTVGDRAFISGALAIHQFCRIGRLAMVAGMSRINQDVPPFTLVEGNPSAVRGLNAVGLRRSGLDTEQRAGIKRVFRELYRNGCTIKDAVTRLDSARVSLSDEGRELLDFCMNSERGVTPGGSYRSGAVA